MENLREQISKEIKKLETMINIQESKEKQERLAEGTEVSARYISDVLIIGYCQLI